MIIGVDFVDLDFFFIMFVKMRNIMCYIEYKNAILGFYIMSVKMRNS